MNRKAAVAVGKDRLPQLVALATNLSSLDKDRRDAAVAPLSETYYQSLLEFGFVVDDNDEASIPPTVASEETFVGRYHAAVHDFDWFDYFDPYWRKKDDYRMQQFHRQAPPPSNFTQCEGRRIELPRIGLEMGSSELTTLDRLSGVLRWSLGPIGVVAGGNYEWLRRTSPSGGARHPTDAYIINTGAVAQIPRGTYFYDAEHHALVASERIEIGGIGPDELRMVLASHVERPMWRYRDFWSYRPIVIDAGHVMETACLLAGHFGLSAFTVSPPASLPMNRHHLANIDMGALALVVGRTQTCARLAPGAYRQTVSRHDDGVITSPFAYFIFRDGELVARTAQSARTDTRVTPDAFMLLQHCLPSTRGDRVTTMSSLAAQFPNVTPHDLEDLMKRRVLLPRADAHEAYAASWLWVRHGWYMSLLAHTESLSARAGVGSVEPHASPPLRTTTGRFLEQALIARKTCRTFSPAPLTLEILDAVLIDALQGALETWHSDCLTVDAWLHGQERTDQCNGYSYDVKQHRLLQRKGRHAARADIRRLAIGQSWASTAGATVLLSTRMRGTEYYVDDLMRLGRVGQRICIAATAAGMGVFLTPAVKDSIAAELLCQQVQRLDSDIYYFLGIGEPAIAMGGEHASR